MKRNYIRNKMLLYQFKPKPINPYTIQSTLTPCKYMVMPLNQSKGGNYYFVTNKLNREAALAEIFQYLRENQLTDNGIPKRKIDIPFEIYITENGVTELLINSHIHKNFVDQYK